MNRRGVDGALVAAASKDAVVLARAASLRQDYERQQSQQTALP